MIKTKGSDYFTNLSEMGVEIFNEAHPNVELSTVEELQAFLKEHYGVLVSIEVEYSFSVVTYTININGITSEGIQLLDNVYEDFAETVVHYEDGDFTDHLLGDYMIGFVKYLLETDKIKPV